ncbi:flagellar filament capping protein FliD [Cohnella candidum]|uniref:Flagellar hook-associated protein 2 n=1 Tax=Cohnella candidum TaxID=2674991 RepID=A0A3G3K0W3_9BACL|nr:flagellar filament capping protein FliD [Cohnella candidum]AYQ74136.1 hypothetical protein EAV92_17140 [Cohnella candidum]
MVTRVSGINSGMDIDKMVSDLMKAERMPQDKLKQKKTTLTWTSDLYREINSKLASFKTVVDNMRLSGDWKANTGSSSNESAVTISADSTASTINHKITVTKLAAGASVSSAGGISTNTLVSTGTPITDIQAGENDQFNISLGGVSKKITLTPGSSYTDTSLAAEIQNQVNNAFGANKIQVSVNAGSLEFKALGTAGNEPQIILSDVANNSGLADLGFVSGQSNKINPKMTLGDLGYQFSTPIIPGNFLINGISINYDDSDTLTSLMNKVNNSAAGVNMSYDEVSDKIVFTTKGVGTTAQIDLQDGTSGNILTALNMTQPASEPAATPPSIVHVTGTDADVTIDGVQSYRSSNTFTTGGVTYNLKQTTTSPVTVSVSQDTDSMVTKIKDFVTKFNDTLDLLNKRVKEVKYRSFTPLTDDQKKAMQAADITLWEDKAKSGLLHNDDVLKSTINDLRGLAVATIPGATSTYNAFYKIGIGTTAYNPGSADNGKLVLDEAALRKALSEDPSSVIAVFSNQPDGVAQKMFDKVTKSIKTITQKAGAADTTVDDVTSDLGDQIHKLNVNITDFDGKLAKKEDYYYSMFAKMDSAVGTSNSQLNWLSKQFQ